MWRAAGMEIDLREARIAAGAMLGAGVAIQLLPGHPGLPCLLRAATGVPCPLCGMTTSVEATLRLDLSDALAATPAGVAAVVAAIVVLALRPVRLRFPPALLYGTLAAMWFYQLHRFSFL